MQTITEIGGLIAAYPEEIKNDVLALYSYMLEKCSGKRKILAANLQTLGFNKSETYFYKLFSGKWIERGVFTASIDGIRAMAKAVKDAELGRLSTGVLPHTETDIVRLIRNAIDAVRQRDNICKWLFIVGSTAGQKSYAANYYAASRASKDTFYFEAPATANLMALATRIARFFGCADSLATYRKVQWCEDNIRSNMCIIIDNAQRLYEPRRGLTQPTFSFLQALQDITKCSIVLIFVDEATGEDSLHRTFFGKDKGFFEQFIGRAGGEDQILRLPNERSDSDLLAFAKSAGFKSRQDRETVLPFLKWLDRQSGKMRVALRTLQAASRFAASENRDITVEDFLQELPINLPDKLLIKADAIRKALPCA